jgi:uncharacterized membrane protein YgcG
VRLRSIAASRWLYVGLPVAMIFIGLFVTVSATIGAAIDNTYHAVVPTEGLFLYAKLFAGLSTAGFFSLLLVALAKYVFRSSHRASMIGLCLIGCCIWWGYLAFTFLPGEDAFRRTFDGKRYSIAWHLVPGELTSSNNPRHRWDEISSIGFFYCVDPFSPVSNTRHCRRGTFLVGRQGVNAHELHASYDDPEGLNLLAHLQARKVNSAGKSTESSSSTSSTGSSSTSSGGSSKSWEGVEVNPIPKVGGMIAYESADRFPSEREVYLFELYTPASAHFHRAICRPSIRNGAVVDENLYCTHYFRDGNNAWILELPIKDTQNAPIFLKTLRLQLEKFRTS